MVQADYSIASNNGGNMQIGETRKIVTTGSGKLETDIEAKVGYDYNRTVPTSVDEYATQRTDAGVERNLDDDLPDDAGSRLRLDCGKTVE